MAAARLDVGHIVTSTTNGAATAVLELMGAQRERRHVTFVPLGGPIPTVKAARVGMADIPEPEARSRPDLDRPRVGPQPKLRG